MIHNDFLTIPSYKNINKITKNNFYEKKILNKEKYYYISILLLLIFLITIILNLLINLSSTNKNFEEIWFEENNNWIKSQLDINIVQQLNNLQGSIIHSILEIISIVFGFSYFIICILHFIIRKKIITYIIGLGILISSSVELIHTLVSLHVIMDERDDVNYLSFTWLLSRIINSIVILLSVIIIIFMKKDKIKIKKNKNIIIILLISFVILLLLCLMMLLLSLSTNLPKTLFDKKIKRPYDIIPFFIFLTSFILILKYLKKDFFIIGILIGIIFDLLIQIIMIFGSNELFDNYFNIAHFYKILSYLFPLLGLIIDLILIFNNQLIEIKNQNKKLIKLNKTKTLFLANMSHEVKTPLANIIGLTELLNETKINNEQKEYIHNILVSGENLLSIIENLLLIGKLENNKILLNNEKFKIKKTLDDILILLSVSLKKKNINILLEIDENIPNTIIGDNNKLKQILINLINNSIKFSKNNSKIIIFIKKIKETNNIIELNFMVKDFGIGVKEENLLKIFKPFEQADKSTTRTYGGTGLGLPICNHLVNIMGGKMKIYSNYGNFSIFAFNIIFQKINNIINENTKLTII